ncbi:MAG: RimJ/RimL family protein N-acetyltransferase [Alphaproteobacteria bacterium]|jgi:RimJ/RimL family protein N-acetyltransferase
MSHLKIHPVRLEDDFVRLTPMRLMHVDDLFQAGQYPEIWQWTSEPYCLTLESTKLWVNWCLSTAQEGDLIPFVILDKTSNSVVGSTSFLNIALDHKVLEIGFTFLTPVAQKSHVNRRCKYLLLAHAFETLNVNRVAFITNDKNTNSRNAILGIGAAYEGTQRNCRIQHNGNIRSSAFFSIIKSEWPAVKLQLKQKIIAQF